MRRIRCFAEPCQLDHQLRSEDLRFRSERIPRSPSANLRTGQARKGCPYRRSRVGTRDREHRRYRPPVCGEHLRCCLWLYGALGGSDSARSKSDHAYEVARLSGLRDVTIQFGAVLPKISCR